jgi:N-acetylglucosamine-6-sulfatase
MRGWLALIALVLIPITGSACFEPESAPAQGTLADANRLNSGPAAAQTPRPELGGEASSETKRPNILFILTDDLDADSVKFMPQVSSLLVDQGISFSNYFISVPFCCPSRASILRGQYAHNTQIYDNRPPHGGFESFHSFGLEDSTIATWLQSSGYRTVLIGKYLNRYPNSVSDTYVPPGWDEWYSRIRGNPYSGFRYTLSGSDGLTAYGSNPEDYSTDVSARKAVDFIQRAAEGGKPFFMYLATFTPHGSIGNGPAMPAPRHQNMFPTAKVPRFPSFNEADVSDKPRGIRSLLPLTGSQIAEIDMLYRKRLQSLQAIDEMVGVLVGALKGTGQLENTYIVFTSDNGFHLGHHRLPAGKQTPYEEDAHVPLIVRGPNVPSGRVVDHLVGNIDLAPTFAEWGGTTIPDFVDGRSLVTLLSNESSQEAQRQVFLLQKHNKRKLTPPFQAIRTRYHLYVEYVTGERELYDLRKDPHQVENIITTADPASIDRLSARLADLSGCASEECRRLENTPLLPQGP